MKHFESAYLVSVFALASSTIACGSTAVGEADGPASGTTAQASSQAPGRGAEGVSANCDAWSTHVDGPYKYENNVWGSNKVKGKFEQCLLHRTRDGKEEVGWSWRFPGFDPTVFAYPQIIFGWKPWSGGKPTDERFPLRIGDARHLALHYEVETQAEGSYNLAPEVWLTESGEWSKEPNAKIITAEIMFWMDYKEGARPAGKVIESPTFDGVTYELWKADEIGDKGDGRGWTLYSFKSPTVRHQGTISIHQLLDHLVKKGHVNPSHYVASVEFGNEVMGGSGTTWVKRFEVELE
jgi:hypothetical protein